MPIITGLQICTTAMKAPRSGVVLAKMVNLLERRQMRMISRKGFLIAWGKLRIALRLTDDYQQLINKVRERAGGVCEFCHQRLGVHVHHIKPVAFKPLLALLDANCAWTCETCHPDADKRSRQDALNSRTLRPRYDVVTGRKTLPGPLVAAPQGALRSVNG